MSVNRRFLVGMAFFATGIQAPVWVCGAPPKDIPAASYTVEHVPAAVIAARAKELLDAAGHNADLTVDRPSNRLIVRGGEEAQNAVRQALAALDVATPQRGPDSMTLRSVTLPAQRMDATATAMQLKYASDSQIKIGVDKRTNQLLIMAPQVMQDALRSEALSISANSPVQQVSAQSTTMSQKLVVQHVPWQFLEDRLSRLSRERPIVTTRNNGDVSVFQMASVRAGDTQIEIDRRSGEITITAPQTNIAGWAKTISMLDQNGQRFGETIDLVRLVNAEPAPIQRAIRLMQNLPEERANPAPARGPQRMRFNGQAIRPAVLQDINQNAGQGNAGQNQGQGGTTQGDPQDVTDSVGPLRDVDVQFIPETGVLIIRAKKGRDMARVRDLINQLEELDAATQPDVRVQLLEHINSGAAATVVKDLYDNALAPRQGQVRITSLDSPNAVLLVGRKEALDSVEEILKKLDQPIDAQTQLKVFELHHASAVDAEAVVRDFFTERPGEDSALRTGLGTRARVIADRRTNSLIVQAAPRDLAQVAEIITRLDVDKIPSTQQIQVFPLKNSIAATLVTVLNSAIAAAEEGVEGQRVPNAKLSIVTVDKEGNRILDSGILSGAVISADANSNSIIVRAPSGSMPLLAELIRQLDQLPGGQSLVKVFGVQYGDASSLVTTLQQLFQLQQQQAQGGAQAGAANQTGAVGPGIGPTQLTSPGEYSVTPIRLAVDRRTNSIIATGSKEDLQVVEALLVRLDTEGLGSRITEVIWLRHATSTNVSTALQNFVQNQQIRNPNTLGLGQASGIIDLLDRDLIVADEPVTNSLIISVAPRLYDAVRRIIDQLDRRPPMVLVKVLLAEVSLNDGVEFGAELGLQDSLLYDRGVITGTGDAAVRTPGFAFNNQPLGNSNSAQSQATRSQVGRQGLTSFLVGRTSETFGYGGFVLSAASDSVNLLMRALQDAGRAQILSRPQVMTMDNTEAVVLVGARVPRIRGVTQATGIAGGSINAEDEDVGLILKIRPRVGSDGLIMMEIDATRSQIDPNPATAIPVGFAANGNAILSPQILTTTAQSTITAYNGQTVIFGGLITKNRNQSSRRVPYLSDIPILGMLFRFDSESEVRSELLAVMTPMIVNSDQDLEYVKITESNRMSWCISDVVEMHGNVGLSPGHGLWGPASTCTIYPDLQPTVDDFPPDVRNPNHGPLEHPHSAVPLEEGMIDQAPISLESGASLSKKPNVQPANYSKGSTGAQVGDKIQLPLD